MLRRKKKKSALGGMVKDIGMFGAGSLVVGAGAKAAGTFGAPYAAGVSTLATGLPAVGGLVMAKAQVGLLSEAMDKLPKQKKQRRRKRK